jgi:hypothetical protein
MELQDANTHQTTNQFYGTSQAMNNMTQAGKDTEQVPEAGNPDGRKPDVAQPGVPATC